jgi:ABC-type transport system involved in multi-copper enzyme maturation permease subunit
MSSLALSPDRSLVSSDLLKLRRRRGLLIVVGLLTVGTVLIADTIKVLLHVSNPVHGPAGGVTMLGHLAWVIATLGAVAGTIVGASAGSGDLDAGVYRDLAVTGRSRLTLFASRATAGLGLLLSFVAAAYVLEAVVSVVFAGGEPMPSTRLLAVTGLWTLLSVAFWYLLAFGVACLVGGRSYTIGIVLAWRLALSPLLASITALGVARELMPGVAIDSLTPAALHDAARSGPRIGMSLAAVAAVLLVWAVAVLVAGAWRDTTRDA